MEQNSTFLPLPDYSRTLGRPFSSIHLIMPFLLLFFIFTYVPLHVEGLYRLETCSTQNSHIVQCIDSNAFCYNSSSTRYGICRCKKPFKELFLFDLFRQFAKTQCVLPKEDKEGRCSSSLQCQLEDPDFLCTFEYSNPLCECRDIDGLVHALDGPGCINSTVTKKEGVSIIVQLFFCFYSITIYVTVLYVVVRLCLGIPSDDDVVYAPSELPPAYTPRPLRQRVWTTVNSWFSDEPVPEEQRYRVATTRI